VRHFVLDEEPRVGPDGVPGIYCHHTPARCRGYAATAEIRAPHRSSGQSAVPRSPHSGHVWRRPAGTGSARPARSPPAPPCRPPRSPGAGQARRSGTSPDRTQPAPARSHRACPPDLGRPARERPGRSCPDAAEHIDRRSYGGTPPRPAPPGDSHDWPSR
jgi:hypothetical protein